MTLTQIILSFHIGQWYLIPFNPQANPVPGLWKGTWLFLTVTVIRCP